MNLPQEAQDLVYLYANADVALEANADLLVWDAETPIRDLWHKSLEVEGRAILVTQQTPRRISEDLETGLRAAAPEVQRLSDLCVSLRSGEHVGHAVVVKDRDADVGASFQWDLS